MLEEYLSHLSPEQQRVFIARSTPAERLMHIVTSALREHAVNGTERFSLKPDYAEVAARSKAEVSELNSSGDPLKQKDPFSQRVLGYLLARLDPDAHKIIQSRIGLADGRAQSQEVVAAETGQTLIQIQQTEDDALKRMGISYANGLYFGDF